MCTGCARSSDAFTRGGAIAALLLVTLASANAASPAQSDAVVGLDDCEVCGVGSDGETLSDASAHSESFSDAAEQDDDDEESSKEDDNDFRYCLLAFKYCMVKFTTCLGVTISSICYYRATERIPPISPRERRIDVQSTFLYY